MGLIQGLGHSSERQEPIDFGEYMAEHLKVFEEVSECLRALGFEKTSLCDEPLLVLRERGREGRREEEGALSCSVWPSLCRSFERN